MAGTVRSTFLQFGFILAMRTQGTNTNDNRKEEFLNIFSIGLCYQGLSLLFRPFSSLSDILSSSSQKSRGIIESRASKPIAPITCLDSPSSFCNLAFLPADSTRISFISVAQIKIGAAPMLQQPLLPPPRNCYVSRSRGIGNHLRKGNSLARRHTSLQKDN